LTQRHQFGTGARYALVRLNSTQFVTIVQACWYISGAETIQ